MTEKPDEQSETEDPSEGKFEKVSDLFGHSNNQPSTEEEKKRYQRADFWIGFIGWFLVNFFLFRLQQVLPFPLLIPFVINVVGISVLFFIRPRIASAALTAFGSLLVVSICAGIVLSAICFSGGII